MTVYVARCAATGCEAIVYRGPWDEGAIDAATDAHIEATHPELLTLGTINGVSLLREDLAGVDDQDDAHPDDLAERGHAP